MTAIFMDPNMAVDAVWVSDLDGSRQNVRVILKQPDEVTSFGRSNMHSETTVFDVRVSDVASPRPDDRIEYGGEVYTVQGDPVRDRLRLIWTVDAVVLP